MDITTCLKALNDYNCPPNVIAHSKAVSKKAVEIAKTYSEKTDATVDVEQVKYGALVHDIGRSKTHSIQHAVVGAEILRDLNFPECYINITLKHIGAGIPCEEAEELGLPKRDYIPSTIEEKIVAQADNLTSGTAEVDLTFVLKKWKESFGKNHPAIKRIKLLHEELLLD
ncbi:metal dependent phosphohydrolase [Methanobacterium lacus]|uniref:Metal dependent phosphohydrolase n=1 Tax=Methanobacterium lacus (strain AL-21) TaxID=877455 RepID=F0TCR2_METLA|nr:TIGR00295 family protein [Methanobacterium lacus]ADZ10452.1 metal dependent phosphohydrolase [Methanobacterium lacus]